MKVTAHVYRFSFSLPVLWYRLYLFIFFTFFLSSCSMLPLMQYLYLLFLLSVCPPVGVSVCFSVCLCLSLSVLIYLCLSVRFPNLSHAPVFHAPSHICHKLPPNTQYGRSRGVCLWTLFLISLLLVVSVTLFPTPSVIVCLSVSCFPVHCSHTCRVIFNRLAGVIMLAAPPSCCIYRVLE